MAASRVAGFTLCKILSEHTEPVTSLAIVDDPELFGQTFLISAGWDRRICIWTLVHFMLFAVYSNPAATSVETAETASTGYIHSMDYSPLLKCFGYAAGSDMCVYVRRFSPIGSDMKLEYKLEARVDAEVTCVKWNFVTNEWVTGMENGEFRIWVIACSSRPRSHGQTSRRRMGSCCKPSTLAAASSPSPSITCRRRC